MNNNISEIKKQKRLAFYIFVAMLFAFLIGQLAGDFIKKLFFGLLSVTVPILLSIFFAYIFRKFITFLENKVFKNCFKKSRKAGVYKRALSLVLLFIIVLSVIILFFILFIPNIIERITDLVNNSDLYINKISTELTEFFYSFNIVQKLNLQDKVSEIITSLTQNIQNSFPTLLEKAVQVASKTTIIIITIILSFTFAVLMLKDKEKIAIFFKRILYANFKTTRADKTIKIMQKTDEIISSYFIGKFLEATIIFILVAIGFFIMGIQNTLLLSFILALFNFIPYLGFIIGIIPILILTLIFASVNTAVIAVLYAIFIVVIITTFVSPFIFGKKLNISAFVVALSIIIGGGLFSIWGMLLAPPVASIFAVIIEENLKEKENLKLIIKSYGVTEEEIKKDEVLIEATKLTLEKKNKKPK